MLSSSEALEPGNYLHSLHIWLAGRIKLGLGLGEKRCRRLHGVMEHLSVQAMAAGYGEEEGREGRA